MEWNFSDTHSSTLNDEFFIIPIYSVYGWGNLTSGQVLRLGINFKAQYSWALCPRAAGKIPIKELLTQFLL